MYSAKYVCCVFRTEQQVVTQANIDRNSQASLFISYEINLELLHTNILLLPKFSRTPTFNYITFMVSEGPVWETGSHKNMGFENRQTKCRPKSQNSATVFWENLNLFKSQVHLVQNRTPNIHPTMLFLESIFVLRDTASQSSHVFPLIIGKLWVLLEISNPGNSSNWAEQAM